MTPVRPCLTLCPVEYLPNATKETAHHILIYGCEAPGYTERDTPRAVWDCGEMAPSDQDTLVYPRDKICKGQSQIVYSWAMDAPSLKLPQGRPVRWLPLTLCLQVSDSRWAREPKLTTWCCRCTTPTCTGLSVSGIHSRRPLTLCHFPQTETLTTRASHCTCCPRIPTSKCHTTSDPHLTSDPLPGSADWRECC